MNDFLTGFADELVKVSSAEMGNKLIAPSINTGSTPKISAKPMAKPKPRSIPGVNAPMNPYKGKVQKQTHQQKLMAGKPTWAGGGAVDDGQAVGKAKKQVAKPVRSKGAKTTAWQRHLRTAKKGKARDKLKAGKKDFLAANKGAQRYSVEGGAREQVAKSSPKRRSGKKKVSLSSGEGKITQLGPGKKGRGFVGVSASSSPKKKDPLLAKRDALMAMRSRAKSSAAKPVAGKQTPQTKPSAREIASIRASLSPAMRARADRGAAAAKKRKKKKG